MTSFQLASGGRWWFIVRCYLAPNDASTIEIIVTAIIKRPRGSMMLVARDFNLYLAAPEENYQRENIAALIATIGLREMSAHFLLRRKFWSRDRRKWCMHHRRR